MIAAGRRRASQDDAAGGGRTAGSAIHESGEAFSLPSSFEGEPNGASVSCVERCTTGPLGR
jgi:hypothetical protein